MKNKLNRFSSMLIIFLIVPACSFATPYWYPTINISVPDATLVKIIDHDCFKADFGDVSYTISSAGYEEKGDLPTGGVSVPGNHAIKLELQERDTWLGACYGNDDKGRPIDKFIKLQIGDDVLEIRKSSTYRADRNTYNQSYYEQWRAVFTSNKTSLTKENTIGLDDRNMKDDVPLLLKYTKGTGEAKGKISLEHLCWWEEKCW